MGEPRSGPGVAADDRFEQDARRAYAYILRSTQHRPQTEAEMAAKLQGRDVPEPAVQSALRRARQSGALDDRAFARAWVDDRGRKRGYGQARLRQELRRRLVGEALIDEALAGLEDRDDLAVATELAARRARQLGTDLDPAAVARRLVSYLVRRGYPPALAQRAAITVAGLDRQWD